MAELRSGNIEAGFTTGFHFDPGNHAIASGQLPVFFDLWNGDPKTTEVFAKEIGVADFGQMAFHGCLPLLYTGDPSHDPHMTGRFVLLPIAGSFMPPDNF